MAIILQTRTSACKGSHLQSSLTISPCSCSKEPENYFVRWHHRTTLVSTRLRLHAFLLRLRSYHSLVAFKWRGFVAGNLPSYLVSLFGPGWFISCYLMQAEKQNLDCENVLGIGPRATPDKRPLTWLVSWRLRKPEVISFLFIWGNCRLFWENDEQLEKIVVVCAFFYGCVAKKT